MLRILISKISRNTLQSKMHEKKHEKKHEKRNNNVEYKNFKKKEIEIILWHGNS